MSNDLKHSIAELLKESSQFNTNDVLVNAAVDHSKLFICGEKTSFGLDEIPKAILREASKTAKESGVNSLCVAHGFVALDVNGKSVRTPLMLTPVAHTIQKFEQLITLEIEAEESFVNPYVTIALELSDVPFTFEALVSEIEGKGLTIEVGELTLGNFHHHRYQVIKELEELKGMDQHNVHLSSLLGFSSETEGAALDLPPNNLFPADTDHEAVFNAANQHNLVIQGPPGTGKSQVLSNLLGKLLKAEKTTVVVSEKRVALEVLKKKLSEFQLDKLCFIATSDHLSHSFLQELKSTWDHYEAAENKPLQNVRVSEQLEDNLQMTLDMLSQEELIGGVSFQQFKSLVKDVSLDNAPYVSYVPEIAAYQKHKGTVTAIYAQQLNTTVGLLKYTSVVREDFNQLDVLLRSWKNELIALGKIFDFTTWSDFNALMKEAARCQIFENELYKKYSAIFQPNSREQNRFLKLRKKYLQAKAVASSEREKPSHWKVLPSVTEVEYLLSIHQKGGGFFTVRKAKKRWQELATIPYSEAPQALEIRQREIEQNELLSQTIIKFCDLGINDPEIEVDLIFHTLEQFSEDQWTAYQAIPAERRQKITTCHRELNELHHAIRTYLRLHDETPLIDAFDQLEKQLPQLLEMKAEMVALNDAFFQTIGLADNQTAFEACVFKSHWVRFKEHFPAFSTFEMEAIKDKTNAIISAQKEEAVLFAREIEQTILGTFSKYHTLLNTPARKLSEEQKALKTRLRKGKSILVKEFAKTRSHPSLRELYNSEAREWIQLLKPIWLSNPTQLSKCFPMEEGLFDVALFDEASQIPLQNALGAVQRSNHIIVAGDEHQMGPTNYFKSGSNEIVDLLHQANYNWPRVALAHHYRSVHPDLIAFSNKHFYNNELKAYPSAVSARPITHHFVENGRFIERINEKEAQAVAEKIKLRLDGQKSIGIVAFSEEQLNCIWNVLGAKEQQQLTDKIDDQSAFFKALENVQGDECDHLIISFGYGKNENDEFHMRFGPMNTTNGRKRLNVLLTRAIETIDFFCSVASDDFKLSDNESINLLRQWIAFSELYTPSETGEFPFQLAPHRTNNTLTFTSIYEHLPTAREIVTLQNVLENRGWQVLYN